MNDRARRQWVAAHILPHEAEVRGWLRLHVRSLKSPDIDDLVQEAYSRLLNADLSGIASGRSYFFAVIRNLLHRQARRARIVPMERMGEIEGLRLPSEELGPERRVGARQELERLARLVGTLPAQARRAFQLQKFHGLTQRQIAQEMNISEKTVEKHLATALSRILEGFREEAAANASHAIQPDLSGHDKHSTD